jgi:hypothetical protein
VPRGIYTIQIDADGLVEKKSRTEIEFMAAHNPDQPEPKRLLFTAEHAENAKMFFVFIIKFFLRDLCALCGEKKYFARKWQDFTTR